MKKEVKTKEQLLKEVKEMQQRIADLEIIEYDYQKSEKALRNLTNDLKERMSLIVYMEYLI